MFIKPKDIIYIAYIRNMTYSIGMGTNNRIKYYKRALYWSNIR